MRTDNQKIFYEFIKIAFIVIVLGGVLGALYEINWRLETKIITGGFFILLAIVANEISRNFNINDHLSEIHSKTLLQLILMGKKQGVKEDVGKVWDDIVNNEKKKLDFQRQLTGNIDAKMYIGFIIAIIIVAFITIVLIQELR